MKSVSALLAFAITLLVAGCNQVVAGNEISLAHIAFIHPGVTGRAEVLKNFGPPMWQADDATAIAYLWQTGLESADKRRPRGPIEPGPTVVNYRTHCFVVRFDADGRVRACNFLEAEDSQQLEARLLDWHKRTAPAARETAR